MALTSQQKKLAELLASGLSQQKAAMQVGVTSRTVRSWLAGNPELRRLVDELSAEAQGQAVTVLSGLLTRAAETLGELLEPGHPDSIRLAAARGVLSDFVAMRQYVDLVAEVNKIKAILEEEEKRRKRAGNGHS
jgi:hypothetical protein